jgi:hypothetical protein
MLRSSHSAEYRKHLASPEWARIRGESGHGVQQPDGRDG